MRNFHIKNINDYAAYLSVNMLNKMSNIGIPKNVTFESDEESLHEIPIEEMREYIFENKEMFDELLNRHMATKINYLYAEGFVREEDTKYVFYSDQEIAEQLEYICE